MRLPGRALALTFNVVDVDLALVVLAVVLAAGLMETEKGGRTEPIRQGSPRS